MLRFLELGTKLNLVGHYGQENRNSCAELAPGFSPQRSASSRERLDGSGTFTATKTWVHSTFFQKVIICAVAGFLAAALIEWAKVFVEGADDALNKGYKHHAVLDTGK